MLCMRSVKCFFFFVFEVQHLGNVSASTNVDQETLSVEVATLDLTRQPNSSEH